MSRQIGVALAVVMAFGAAASASPRISLVGQHPSWANAANDRGVVANQTVGRFTVHLARSPARQAAFDALLAAQQTPGSPQYHQWLTPAQIGERFGASDADLAAVTSWLRDAGFTVMHVANSKMFIEVAATSVVAANAFDVQFHSYAVGATTLTSVDREPTIPARLGSSVTGVQGLHQLDVRPLHVRGGIRHLHSDIVDSNGDHSVGAADFATIYDLGQASLTLSGKTQTIGIIGRSRVFPADVTNFGSVMDVTMPTPTVVIPNTGVDPGSPCGDSSCTQTSTFDDQIEATLDVLRAGSIAPGATVQLIVSTSSASNGEDGVYIALEFAIDNFGTTSTANILNISFGSCEAGDTSGQADATSLDMLYAQASMQGQSVFVSAGDAGAAGCQPDGQPQDSGVSTAASINILGSSGNVTCMGGTKFADQSAQATYWNGSGAAVSYIPEGAWNEGVIDGMYLQLGGGGGESLYIAQPTFQTTVGSAGSMRLVPDIAFDSATVEGYVVCLAAVGADCASDTSFSYEVVGGTSAAAPDMSGVTALIGQAVGKAPGNLNATLYTLGADPANGVFHDVTVASSGVGTCDVTMPSLCDNTDPGPSGPTGGTVGFAVATGYDEATGWGSIDISQLIEHWPGAISIAPMLTADPTSLTVHDGQSGTASLTATGFAQAPTFSCTAGLPSNATCSFNGDTLTIAVSGKAAGVTAGDSPSSRARGVWLVLPLGFALLALSRRPRRTRRLVAGFAVLAIASLVSCNNGSNATTDAATPVTSSVTITATAGAASATASLSLTVN